MLQQCCLQCGPVVESHGTVEGIQNRQKICLCMLLGLVNFGAGFLRIHDNGPWRWDVWARDFEQVCEGTRPSWSRFFVVGLINACKKILETLFSSEPKAMGDGVSLAIWRPRQLKHVSLACSGKDLSHLKFRTCFYDN